MRYPHSHSANIFVHKSKHMNWLPPHCCEAPSQLLTDAPVYMSQGNYGKGLVINRSTAVIMLPRYATSDSAATMGSGVILTYLLRLDGFRSHNSARPAVTGRSWADKCVRFLEVGRLGLFAASADLGCLCSAHTTLF